MSFIEYVHCQPNAAESSAKMADLLGYPVEDLAQNRIGKLSMNQARYAGGVEIFTPLYYAGLSLLGMLFIRFAYLSYAKGYTIADSLHAIVGNLLLFRLHAAGEALFTAEGPSAKTFNIAAIGACLAALYKVIKLPWPLAMDLFSLKVSMVEGRVDVQMEDRKIKVERGREEKIPVYYLRAGGRRFEVEKPLTEAVEPGQPYYLYFLRRSGLLIAMEPKMAAVPEPAKLEAQST